MTGPNFGSLQPAADSIAAMVRQPRRSTRAKRHAADRFVAEYVEHQAAEQAERDRQARVRQFWAEQGRAAVARGVRRALYVPGKGDSA